MGDTVGRETEMVMVKEREMVWEITGDRYLIEINNVNWN
jgi:hypothetical protein